MLAQMIYTTPNVMIIPYFCFFVCVCNPIVAELSSCLCHLSEMSTTHGWCTPSLPLS